MDCCVNTKDKNISSTEVKGGKMEKSVILWVIIAILALAVLYIVFRAPSGATGQVIQSAGQVASSGMVGGC